MESQISSRLLPGNLVFWLIVAILNPYLNCLILIEPTRSNHVFRGVACNSYNSISMTFEFLHYFSCLEIPQVEPIIFWTADNVLAICDWKCSRNAELWVNVSSICLQELTCGEVPESLHWRWIQKRRVWFQSFYGKKNNNKQFNLNSENRIEKKEHIRRFATVTHQEITPLSQRHAIAIDQQWRQETY